MHNCKEYSSQELSLVIYNDEYLYNQRHSLTEDDLKQLGISYTSEQWEKFQDDLLNEDN